MIASKAAEWTPVKHQQLKEKCPAKKWVALFTRVTPKKLGFWDVHPKKLWCNRF
jgi:hypothetical protein